MRGPLLLILAASLLSTGATAAVTTKIAPDMGFRRDQLKDYKGKNENPDLPEYQGARKKGEFYRQADAFETASEQGVYMQAYQMMYGPYGMKQDPQTRQANLQKTAQAIQDCVNNIDCSEDKQTAILTSLVQYNYGQELKRYVLTNNTIRENMRTIDEAGPDLGPNQPGHEVSKIEESLKRGSSTVGAKSAKTDLSYSSGIAKPAYYQLDESKFFTANEQEVLGDKFMTDYRDFVKHYTSIDRNRDQGRYFRYIPSKPGSQTYVIDPSRQVDNARLAEVEGEQNNENIQKIVTAYADSVVAPTFKKIKDPKTGEEKIGYDNVVGGKLGLSKVSGVPQIEENGKLRDAKAGEEFNAIARDLNKEFKDVAEKKIAATAKERSPANDSSGASSAPAAPQTVNVVLDPVRFDQFLDEIWPPSAVRRQRLQNAQRAEVNPRAADPSQN